MLILSVQCMYINCTFCVLKDIQLQCVYMTCEKFKAEMDIQIVLGDVQVCFAYSNLFLKKYF